MLLDPRFDPATGLVGNSYAEFLPSEVSPVGHILLKLLAMFGLVSLDMNVGTKGEMRVSNLTIINFVLRVIGPTHERTLVIYMLAIQVGKSYFELKLLTDFFPLFRFSVLVWLSLFVTF